MAVITFEDYTPLPRHDSKTWVSARIEESSNPDGPWAALETKTLDPPDSDPTNPMARSFTTELASDTMGLWYRIVFVDQDGDEQLPTEPIQNLPADAPPYLPTIRQVGSLLRARTVNANGTELGTFTTDTRPTASEALTLIYQAVSDVVDEVDVEIPERLWQSAASVTALRAAMLIELSYFPEQVAMGRSPYDRYERLYEDSLARLLEAVERETTEDAGIEEDVGGPGMPHFSFPPKNVMVGWDTIM